MTIKKDTHSYKNVYWLTLRKKKGEWIWEGEQKNFTCIILCRLKIYIYIYNKYDNKGYKHFLCTVL